MFDKKKKNIAIVSDGGTPLISDPGLYLIQKCHEEKIRVVPLPGPCAAITALSASGLSSLKFCYEGFLSSKNTKRLKRLKELKKEERTIIFYESSHRIEDSLKNMMSIFGEDRKISIAKELTKIWETIYSSSTKNVLIWLKKESLRQKGEWVIIVEGYKNVIYEKISEKIKFAYSLINEELSSKKSIEIISKLYKISKNKLYKYIFRKKMTKKKINV
uniref:16S rRNA (cytidine(1402)-2'-O)-methyltransferase n=1 Tax=Buchnera aphidicola TaxID=9 RepID=UPI003F78EC44